MNNQMISENNTVKQSLTQIAAFKALIEGACR